MNGFLLVDKPLGISSFGAIQQLNRQFLIQKSSKKIGHGGTLDPCASGLLVVAIGKATRFLRYFLGSDKQYEATVKFGIRTSSDDLEGEIIAEAPWDHISRSDIEQALPQFLGTILQVPPDYSAIHVDGERAYDLARQGQKVEIPPREVRIDRLEILECQFPDNPILKLSVECSGGTYIRSLARDLGHALQSEACLTGLRRTKACHFDIAQSFTLEYLMMEKDISPYLHSCEEAMSFFPSIQVDYNKSYRLLSGLPVNLNISADGIYTILYRDLFIAVLERKDGHNDYLRLFSLLEFKQITSSEA